ncbi:histidine kinase [Geomonas sp. Red276]
MADLHYAPIILLVVCELLLFWADRYAPLPAWFHMSVMVILAPVLVILSAALRKRDGSVVDDLRMELTGMQQEVTKAARRYKSLLEGAGNAIFVFNAETGALEEVNGLGTELLGYSKEELSSMEGRDLLDADEREKFRSFVYQIKRRGMVSGEVMRFQRKDGSLFLGEINARLIDLRDEQVVHCILRDITQHDRVEKEIRQRNRELSILIKILTGITSGPGLDGVPQDTLVEIIDLFDAGGGTVHLLDAEGKDPHLSVSRDVSPHLARLLGAFVATAPERFRTVRLIGGRSEDTLLQGAAAEGWASLTVIPLVVQENLIGVMHLMHRSIPCYSEQEILFLESVGKQVGSLVERNRLFAEVNWKSAELLRSHHLLEKASHNLSISEIKLKQNLALVEQANLELSRLDRMKNQFLGMVSHEFNTPLTSIISGADLLLKHPDCSADEIVVLTAVLEGGMRLKELVADLLKLIKLEARGGEMEHVPIQLDLFLDGVKEQLKPQLVQRNQSVKLTQLEELPFFAGDRESLERIFAELLLNAIKYSPDGSEIEVTGEVVDSRALWARKATLDRFNPDFLKRCGDRCYLEVRVKDQGMGIPPQEQQGIFEIFYEIGEIRHHSSGSSRLQGKGAGLGLAMVKGMVEAHGGMVWVESEGGSTFFLLLPLEPEVSQPELF